MTANEMYQKWKSRTKVNLAVYTDEQMFTFGYNSRNNEVDELIDLIDELSKKLEELNGKTSKPKKDKLL